MNLRPYFEHHDGRLSRTGKEVARLARAADCSVSHLYLCALGLKVPSRKLASRLAEKSKGRKLDPASILGLKA
jgi:hypothetical protein